MTRSILALMLLGASAVAQEKREKTVILVHGAFADGSSWDKVIPLLEAKGLHVVAVQNPLTSLADDVAATKRSEEHTSELQSRLHLVCRLLLEKKKKYRWRSCNC